MRSFIRQGFLPRSALASWGSVSQPIRSAGYSNLLAPASPGLGYQCALLCLPVYIILWIVLILT